MQDISIARRFAVLWSLAILGLACGGSKLRVTVDAPSERTADSVTPDRPSSDGGAGGSSGVVGTGGEIGSGGATVPVDVGVDANGDGLLDVPLTGDLPLGTDSGSGSDGSGGFATGGTTSIGGTGGTGGTGGSSAACPACQAHESCWSGATGARCIESSVPIPAGFAIDATEVTRGQYAAWLASGPGIAGQSEVCAWNASFEPDPGCMALPQVCQGSSCSAHPQVCIDMCDAAAYCGAIGRHLCSEGDWRIACSSNGQYAADYGPNFTVGVCNDYTVYLETTVPVASRTGCQAPASSGYAGVYDLIGNAEEWADNCTPSAGASDTCKPLGLPFGQGAAAPICAQSTYANRSAAKATLGFRCCTP